MPTFRRGAEEIEKSTQRASGGGFVGFAPSIRWQEDKQEEFLLFLTQIEDVPRYDAINFIPVKKDGEFKYYASVVARTDPAIGESSDAMVEKWQAPLKDSNLFVAVRLVPTLEERRGRARPTSFTVATREFERRVRDEDGELTEETETATAPDYGFIQESASNFGSIIASYDESEAPITETAVKIQRSGMKTDTKYMIAGYPDIEIDLTPLLNNVDTISYLSEEERSVINAAIENEEDPFEAARAIASVLLEKRLNELADETRYNTLFEGITETLDKFGKDKKKSGQKNNGSSAPKPSRPSQRKKDTSDEPVEKQKDEDALASLEALRSRAGAR